MGKLPIHATVKDTDGTLLNGSVTLKINGVVQKDASGNVIKFDVTDGIVDGIYQLPAMSAKNYTLSLMYVNSKYSTQANSTLILTKTDIEDLDIKEVVTQKGDDTTIKTQIKDITEKPLVGTTKVVIKINGKKVNSTTISSGMVDDKITTIINNGILDTTIDTHNMKEGNYNITIILGENSYYNSKTVMIPLIIK